MTKIVEFDINNIYQDLLKSLSKYKYGMIIGEIIKFKISDGNAWIDIKFKDNQITGVFWKIINDWNYTNLKNIKPGEQIKFYGDFTIMKKNLNIYFKINSMEKFGKGDYLDLYEQYRIKIKDLNLGLPKKFLNIFPYNIGIITALEGAAIQDILQTFKLDNFIGNIIIKNTFVQGSQCPNSIIKSIEWFEQNYSSQIDLLMITRGGGSYEDLVGFSNWDVLIKLSNCPFITLSAVGHQIDNQLTDEICDYKFTTPSIGAKFIVETQQKYKFNLQKYTNLLNDIMTNYSNNKSKFNIIHSNYSNIINNYDIKYISIKLKKYQYAINNILSKYSDLKHKFFTRLTKLKPTITRNEIIKKNKNNDKINNIMELTSITDFIDLEHNKEIKPKKIEINFIDGRIVLNYKIIDYECY